MTTRPTLIVVSGMSGSGKSVALNTLEDMDFYCVDNLPADLLPQFVQSVTGEGSTHDTLSLLFESFAYRRGVPPDADFVFDVRPLPNPHWDARLRPLSGRDADVRAYLDGNADVEQYATQVEDFLATWLPRLLYN